MEGNVIVELRNIRKEFPGVIALDQVNMKIREGSVHALVGENGAGKSTLMKILSGTYQSYGGQVIISGREVHMKSQKDAFAYGISIVAQELNFVPEMTIEENLYLGRTQKKGIFLDKKKRREDSQRLLEMMGLDYDPGEKMKNLSVAQRQMVEIIKALSRNAKVIVMDEPTSALTNQEASILFRKVRELRKTGIAFVFISHRLEEVFELCDEYTVLRDGKWIASGSISDITQDKMISMMVGRAIEDIYPDILPCQDKVVFEAEKLNGEAFHDVSFQIRSGEIFGFAGMMGAGRSEIARAIFGMDPLESGSIRIDGQEKKFRSINEAIHGGVAMITEDRATYGFVGVRSISDNVALANLDQFSSHGVLNHKRIELKTQEIFDSLNIKAPGIGTNVGNLSGGNQQKVVLAKWLVRDVRLLIMDEPTRGIDVGAKQEIYNLLVSLAQKGIAILLISSDMPEVLSMSHRTAVVANGKIVGILPHGQATQDKVMKMIVEAK
ncbi:MAG: sugar ABC transporter ATP-binding protein [Porcincola intestinalis]|uniref:sugar ABC transporter ATP-binding protein n=1 Tax=Porcincola intestinalis TaxID=2606632 RepID=UPI002A917B16|nr:sugar ABC transporter ATP-binding protein [Porcincola intestinalis]MDY5331264.1 sugar ABC transporter ATP-binding protein [Porcincola intestinalis]